MPDSKILQPALPALASLPPVSQSGDLVPPVGAQTPFRTEASSPAAWRQGQTAPRLTLPLGTDVVGAQPSPASVGTIIKYAVLGARCPGLAQQALRPALGQACEVPCWPGGAWVLPYRQGLWVPGLGQDACVTCLPGRAGHLWLTPLPGAQEGSFPGCGYGTFWPRAWQHGGQEATGLHTEPSEAWISSPPATLGSRLVGTLSWLWR